MQSESGIGFVTEDRKAQGLALGMSCAREFQPYASRALFAVPVRASMRENARAVSDFVRMLGIKTPGVEQKVVNLSGGNQQKIVIARWVARSPKVLIVDEPTRGIDVGAKGGGARADCEARGRGHWRDRHLFRSSRSARRERSHS